MELETKVMKTLNRSKSKLRFNREQLYEIDKIIWENIEFVLDYFDIDAHKSGDRYHFSCPIHDGDNISAVSIKEGFWSCFTRGCDKTFYKTLLGFVRGILSNRKCNWASSEKQYPFEETLKFIVELLKIDIDQVKTTNEQTLSFISNSKLLNRERNQNDCKLTRDFVRSKLLFPATPLLERGFCEKTLDSYDVGICNNFNRLMSNRIVVPIYDDNYRYVVASLGRAVKKHCEKCKLYHDGPCPNEKKWLYSKWINSTGFHRDSYLFNYWRAKKIIEKAKIAILVEGPLDILRLEQNKIKCGLAIFGSTLTDGQTILLEKTPIQHLVVMPDKDEAGSDAKEQIKEQCERLFKLHFPPYTSKDVGCMTSNEIEDFRKYLRSINVN